MSNNAAHTGRYAFLFALIIAAPCSVPAQNDSTKLEFSFGTSQMYINETNRTEYREKEKIILPTQSALFLAEYFFLPRFGGMLVFNLPLSPQKMIVDSVLVEEKASPYLGLGARWSPFTFPLFSRLHVETQLAFLFGPMILNDWSLVAVPVAAGRLHVTAKGGFTMYIGGYYTLGIYAPSVIYGVGHRF